MLSLVRLHPRRLLTHSNLKIITIFRGYTYYGNGHECGSTITQGQAVAFVSPTFLGNSWDFGTPTTNKWVTGTAVGGDGIPIWWQSSDVAMLARASAMASTAEVTANAQSVSRSTSGTALPSDTSTAAATSGSGGLSTGAKIGIGVSVPVGFLVALLLGFLLWRRRRNRQGTDAGIGRDDMTQQEKTGLPTPSTVDGNVHELHSPHSYGSRHELPPDTTWHRRSELPETSYRQ